MGGVAGYLSIHNNQDGPFIIAALNPGGGIGLTATTKGYWYVFMRGALITMAMEHQIMLILTTITMAS